jgi:hypothetical protein
MLIEFELCSSYLKILFGRVQLSRFRPSTTYTIMRLELRLDLPQSYVFQLSTKS